MSSPPGGSNHPSLGTDSPEDNLSKLTSFLHKVAGYVDEEVSAILKEHCYARPWNWRPENVYVKPTIKIFFTSKPQQARRKSHKRNVIDVENYDEPEQLPLPSDLTNPRNCIEEALRLVNFTRPEDSNDDWEEKIEKTLWSPVQRRIFSRIFMIINSERLHRLTKVNNQMELIYRRTSTDSSAKKFREVMASINWDYRILQWLHGLLVDNLSREALIIYLDILQTLRAKAPQLVDRMTAPIANAVVKPGSIPLETLNALLKRPWDPVTTCFNTNRPKPLPGDPILIIAPSGIGNASPRQQKWIAQLRALGTLTTVQPQSEFSASKMTMMTCLEHLVVKTRGAIQDVRSDYPGRPMILVGFNSGAALACQVALMEHVTAVICLGFPFATVEGKRGSLEDTLMDIRCPIMFVIGQNSTLVRPDDLENVREKLLVESCLVIVGTADDSLRISTNKKINQGVTQCMVDRCIMDEIADFISCILLQPHPLPLRPAGLSNPDKNKREVRKRKNSTSSSVDSESNFPNVQKKNRPGTPAGQFNPIRNQGSLNKSTGILNAQSTFVTAGSSNDVGSHNSVPRRKSKIINNQKLNPSDQLLSRQSGSITSNSNGITLNIGSMASLSPMGPIRLPALPSNHSINTMKSNSNSRTPVSLSKPPKMTPSNNTQNFSGKLKTITPTNKTFNNYKAMEKSGETKLVTVLTSNGNQVRVAAPSGGQNKSAGTGVLHNRKNCDNLTEGKITNQTVAINHGESSTTTASIASTTTKVMECTSSSANLNLNNAINITRVNDRTPVTESTTSNSITILPWSSKIKTSLKNDDTLSKITAVNHKNQWPKNHQQLTPPLIKTNPSLEVDDDDLGNILDIPIIFAKDDDNLNAIEKSPPISLPLTSINDSVQQKPLNKINPTKVVLLSNKEGKVYQRPGTKISPPKKTDHDQNQSDSVVNRVIFQRRMQNSSISSSQASSSGNNNQQPVKYTKIILSKRGNPGTSTKYTDQVVLTKNTTHKRTSSQLIVGDQSNSSYTTTSTPIKVMSKLTDKSNNDNNDIIDSEEKTTVQIETSDCKLFDESDI